MTVEYHKIEDTGKPGFRHAFGGVVVSERDDMGEFLLFGLRELGGTVTVEAVQPSDSDVWDLEIRGV